MNLNEEMLSAWNEPNGVQACIEVAENYAQSYYNQKIEEAGKELLSEEAINDSFKLDGKIGEDITIIPLAKRYGAKWMRSEASKLIAKLKQEIIQQTTAKNEWKLLNEAKIVELNKLRSEIEKKDEEISDLKEICDKNDGLALALMEAQEDNQHYLQKDIEKDKQIESLKSQITQLSDTILEQNKEIVKLKETIRKFKPRRLTDED